MTEDQLEQEALGWLAEVGYATRYGPDLAPDGASLERADYRQVVLVERLRAAVDRLNPAMPAAARADAVAQVLDLGDPVLLSANRRFHKLLVGGVPVEYPVDGDGASEARGDLARLIDWADPAANAWLASISFRSPGPSTRAGRTSFCL